MPSTKNETENKTNTQNTPEKGKLSVHTENLLPIIKKWLYSERDIFLRELVSNAHDAIKKLDRLSDLGEYKGDLPSPLINIAIDKEAKTITFNDNGLGLTKEEIEKYINQIAFSGAEEFVKKHHQDGKENDIIGHFGLGFFSSYMVADLVEINSLSYQENSTPTYWQSDGGTEYTLKAGAKKEIGTSITLHINQESEDLLDEEKIKNLVEKFSNFLPVEVQVNGKKANLMNALWQRKPNAIKDEEYKDFYKKLFPYEMEPIFYIHLNVDFPFKLKGILYFPVVKPDFDINAKGRIKLFSNNVFVSDNILDIIPNYFNLLRGVIDSPDIPLNVSRSALQTDNNVRKISSHIIKKIADKLHEIYKEKKEDYEKNWESLSPFIKLGMLNDNDFYDKIKDIVVFKNSDDKFTTLADYKKNNSKIKDKVLYASDAKQQSIFIDSIAKAGVEVLILDSPIDNHFIQHLEMKETPLRFSRVDSDTSENLLKDDADKKDNKADEKADEKNKKLALFIKKSIGKEKEESFEVKFDSFADEKLPCLFILNEQMRRFKEMSLLQSFGKEANDLSLFGSLVFNDKNPLVKKIKSLGALEVEESKKKAESMIKDVYHLGLLQQGLLQGKDLSNLITKVASMLEKN